MKQYNFKITSELEEKVKRALADSGFNGKSEFLEDMVTVYSSHLVNRNETNLDISGYKHINNKTKEILQKSFLHLASTMDYNFSSLLQEKLFIEEEKKRVEEKSIEIDNQVNKIKIELLEEQKAIEAKYKEEIARLLAENKSLKDKSEKEALLLTKIQNELSSLSMIADQTSSVIDENKELRAKVPQIEKEHREEIVKINNACLQEKKVLEEKYLIKLDSVEKELGKVTSLYNQLLGKIEIFEKFSKDKN